MKTKVKPGIATEHKTLRGSFEDFIKEKQHFIYQSVLAELDPNSYSKIYPISKKLVEEARKILDKTRDVNAAKPFIVELFKEDPVLFKHFLIRHLREGNDVYSQLWYLHSERWFTGNSVTGILKQGIIINRILNWLVNNTEFKIYPELKGQFHVHYNGSLFLFSIFPEKVPRLVIVGRSKNSSKAQESLTQEFPAPLGILSKEGDLKAYRDPVLYLYLEPGEGRKEVFVRSLKDEINEKKL